MNLDQAQLALKNWFGYDTFRPLQKQVIECIYKKKDALVLMPTGGGKSICFQIPAITLDGMALVVSPLISLMKDQVEALKAHGIAAAYLNSSQSIAEQSAVENKVLQQQLKLLYVSPEKLVSSSFWPLLQSCQLSLFAIDEAHCISSWGHDFRKEYTQLKFLRKQFSNVPIIALTATADKMTREDIKVQLGMPGAQTFLSSFDRPNFTLEVRPGLKKLPQIENFLQGRENESGIIYCNSRKATEKLSEKLSALGYSVDAYHAGRSAAERSKVQEAFINDRLQIVCATIAFGMGIDKSNVRFIIHHNLPQSIENYYQEIGRAGRDGLPADTLLFYSMNDIATYHFLFDEEDQQEKSVKYAKLDRMLDYAQSLLCRRKILLNYFSEPYNKNCGKCDICKNAPRFFDGTIYTQKALSAVARTDQKIGVGMLIDILKGAQKKELFNRNFHLIKTYGAGGDLSAFDWKFFIQQMIQLGVFEIAYHQKNHLHITAIGKKILLGEKKIELASPESLKAKLKKSKKESVKAKTTGIYDKEIFQELRALRRSLAQKNGVPPYIIFSDASLEEMAEKLPADEFEFSQINGVGEVKLKKYGPVFLEAMKKFQQKVQN